MGLAVFVQVVKLALHFLALRWVSRAQLALNLIVNQFLSSQEFVHVPSVLLDL